MDHRVAGRIGQAQFQDVPIILVDELPEDLFGLFVEAMSWFPDETAQQAKHANDEHTGKEHDRHAQEITASAACLNKAREPRYDGTYQDRIHAHLDEEEVQITDRCEHFRNILRDDAEHDTDNDG